MGGFDDVLQRLEELLGEIEALDDPVREQVFELLDGIDAMHRMALGRLGQTLEPETLEQLRGADPAVGWLFDAYAVGIDERAAADAALESVRPYIESHGGSVDVLGAEAGVVQLKLSGACSGCTASAVTLREGVEEALRDNFAGFRAMEVEEDDGPAHPPPGPTLLQIQPHPG